MTPDKLAKSDSEHAHQRAFFAWANMAAEHGFIAACDQLSYTERGHAAKRCDLEGDAPRPELRWMHAIPNGGGRTKSEAGKLKAEGVKAGVLDTFLPKPSMMAGADLNPRDAYVWYHGLYIEFKEPGRRSTHEGGMSDKQVAFADHARDQGYCVRVAYTWREAANIVMAYYGVDKRVPRFDGGPDNA